MGLNKTEKVSQRLIGSNWNSKELTNTQLGSKVIIGAHMDLKAFTDAQLESNDFKIVHKDSKGSDRVHWDLLGKKGFKEAH